ncbi:MAG: DUF3467 domain-containing protein [Lachnospiraceae bacterium]|nr:DUF3467 domain-containing protein [Lachnospiraceae bacterium]
MDNPIYANGFRVAVSQMETQLMFRVDTPQFDEKDQMTGIERKDVADIRISPILAKTLRDILVQHVDAYEKQFGEIKMGDQQS